MKKIVIVIVLMGCILITQAQSDSKQNTLFNSKGVHGVFTSFESGYSQMDNRNIVTGEAALAYISNEKLTIGVKGNILIESDVLNYPNYDQTFLWGGYGGLYLEYTLTPHKLLHVTFPVVLGVGGISRSNYYHNDLYYHQHGASSFFVGEIGANLELNVFRYMKLYGGASYRSTSTISNYYYTIDNLNGLSLKLGVKLGIFDIGRKRTK